MYTAIAIVPVGSTRAGRTQMSARACTRSALFPQGNTQIEFLYFRTPNTWHRSPHRRSALSEGRPFPNRTPRARVSLREGLSSRRAISRGQLPAVLHVSAGNHCVTSKIKLFLIFPLRLARTHLLAAAHNAYFFCVLFSAGRSLR